MKRPLVHIGYHKTGSSWLQKRFFPQAPGWSYLDRHVFSSWIVNVHSLEFDASEARSKVEEWLAQVPDAVVPVVSHERLSGYPHSGGYDSREIAERLASVLPTARILIGIREQESMLFSGYRQYVKDGGPCTLRKYLKPQRTGDSRVPAFRPEHYAYDRLIAVYQGLFGTENVLVLPYELFQSDPESFVAAIERFTEVDPAAASGALIRETVNPGLPMSSIIGIRWANRWFHRNDLNPCPVVDLPRVASSVRITASDIGRYLPRIISRGMETRSREVVAAFAGGLYGHSNARTTELTGLDLAGWDYDVDQG